MSVQIVENWVDVRGRLVDWRASEDVSDHLVLEIDVESVEPVAGYPNMFEGREGETIEVLARESVFEGDELRRGAPVECRVRKATLSRSYAHPERCRVER